MYIRLAHTILIKAITQLKRNFLKFALEREFVGIVVYGKGEEKKREKFIKFYYEIIMKTKKPNY